MSMDRESKDGEAKPQRGVLCVECEHLNPPGGQICSECEATLFAPCAACGHRNERIYTRCAGCRRPLQRSKWSQWKEKLFGKSRTAFFLSPGMLALNSFFTLSVSETVNACLSQIS